MAFLHQLIAMASTDAGRAFEWQATLGKSVETLGYWDLATPTAVTSYERAFLTAIGYGPYHLWYCPMRSILGDEEELLDTTQYSRIELETTSSSNASTSSTPAIIAEYLMT